MRNSQSQTILVVDDTDLQLDLLTTILSDMDSNPILETAKSGGEALDLLKKNPEKYDVVLLDWEMPEIDGIKVLNYIRAHKTLKNIPVIMQTAKTDKEDLLIGLQAGAYHYLTKPYEADLIITVVETALAERDQYKSLVQKQQNQDNTIKLLQQAIFNFKTLEEANTLAGVLANIYEKPAEIVGGLAELLINAVEHGNLGISYEEKSKLKSENRWESEIQHRLHQAEYKHKVAKIEVSQYPEMVEFLITDEGKGFDWEPFMDFDVERLLDSHGRGIAMANKTCFTSVEFRGAGNIVCARIDKTPTQSG